MRTLSKVFRWLATEAWEKINIVATFREILELGRKYGRRFLVMAVVWEIIEDVVFPFLSWKAGVPELIPVFLVLHFEPVVYPVALWAFKTYDRFKGREPWEPDRTAMSSHWRTLLKVTVYRLVSLTAFSLLLANAGLSLWLLSVYTMAMALFGFAHERIWHDSNYGITADDQVEPKRILLKALTYRAVSMLVMGMVLYGFLHTLPWGLFLGYQGAMLNAYIILEGIWARTTWGIQPVSATLNPKTGVLTLSEPPRAGETVRITYTHTVDSSVRSEE